MHTTNLCNAGSADGGGRLSSNAIGANFCINGKRYRPVDLLRSSHLLFLPFTQVHKSIPLYPLVTSGGCCHVQCLIAWFGRDSGNHEGYMFSTVLAPARQLDNGCTPNPRIGRLRQESFLAVISTAITSHTENGRGWNRSWALVADPDNHSEPAIWIWVNDLLLDSSNEALVIDCCVLPVACVGDALSLQLQRSAQFGSSVQGGPILTCKVKQSRRVLGNAPGPAVIDCSALAVDSKPPAQRSILLIW